MVIKRLDGSDYRIKGPNKLLLNQDIWFNDERLQLHNFDQLIKEVINVEPVKQYVEPVVEKVPPPEPVEEPVNRSQHRSGERLLLFCLPTKKVEYTDPLYGDVMTRYAYGDPFQFQASVADDSDTRMSYWTTIDKVTEQSVIFHPSRMRWWKVQKIEVDKTSDGWLLRCTPSDIKPDFTTAISAE